MSRIRLNLQTKSASPDLMASHNGAQISDTPPENNLTGAVFTEDRSFVVMLPVHVHSESGFLSIPGGRKIEQSRRFAGEMLLSAPDEDREARIVKVKRVPL